MTVYAVSSVTGGGTLWSKYAAITTRKDGVNYAHGDEELEVRELQYPQACGPHSSKVISSGPARPWRWLSIAANAVIEKSCGADGGLERRCYVWSAGSARGEISG